MSMCRGKRFCEIYRDKKYCQKRTEREDPNGICDCRHARWSCEIGECGIGEDCYIYEQEQEARKKTERMVNRGR